MPTGERSRLCHWCFKNPEQAAAAREAEWTTLPNPPPVRHTKEHRGAPVTWDLPIFEDEWSLPDRLACLPARPWTMVAIRLIAAVPCGVWETREVEECLEVFGWRRELLRLESRGSVLNPKSTGWRWRWIPPAGWMPE